MDFAGRLKLAMQERNIKAVDLAKRAKLSEGAISQYLRGKYQAGQRSLDRLAFALNVPVPWLMGEGEDKPVPCRAIEDYKANDETFNMLFDQLDERARYAAIEYLRFLLEKKENQ